MGGREGSKWEGGRDHKLGGREEQNRTAGGIKWRGRDKMGGRQGQKWEGGREQNGKEGGKAKTKESRIKSRIK